MLRRRSFYLIGSLLSFSGALACHSAVPEPERAVTPSEHSLSGLAAQKIVLLPTYSIRIVPGLGWGSAIGRPVDIERTLDADILAALDERGLRKTWLFPEDLAASYRRNMSYATDPYSLAEEPIRSPALMLDARLAEPLASQLRTMIALHEDVRLVLAPVEVRFERAGTGGRGVLRLILIDPRSSAVRFIAEIPSDTVAAFGPVISASIASRLANVLGAP